VNAPDLVGARRAAQAACDAVRAASREVVEAAADLAHRLGVGPDAAGAERALRGAQMRALGAYAALGDALVALRTAEAHARNAGAID